MTVRKTVAKDAETANDLVKSFAAGGFLVWILELARSQDAPRCSDLTARL